MTRHRWEEIDHPDAVQTPAEVYSSLAKQGFAVQYCRVPVTDGTAPTVGVTCTAVTCIAGVYCCRMYCQVVPQPLE